MSETIATGSNPVHPVGTLLRAPDGVEFQVEDYVSQEDLDNDSEDGAPFYWGSNGGGLNNVHYPAEGLVLVKTVAQLAARTLPTVAEIANAIGSSLSDIGDSIDGRIWGSDIDPSDGSIEFHGTTSEGLGFSFTVQVSNIREAQL